MSQSNNSANIVAFGAFLGATGVLLGAFGAHALSKAIPPSDLAIFETGVRYQLLHAVTLVAIAQLPTSWNVRGIAMLWLIGTLIFSGSLYLLVMLNQRWFGAITPIGGLHLIAGWVVLALTAFRQRPRTSP